MTTMNLLDALVMLADEEFAEMCLPVAPNEKDPNPEPRPPEGHKMRLPDSSKYKQIAPYYIHQLITGSQNQPGGDVPESKATVRTIFCVFNKNEEEGALALLNLIERFRLRIIRDGIVGQQFELDAEEGVEFFIYPDETRPYYGGEVTSVWKLPAVKREVKYY